MSRNLENIPEGKQLVRKNADNPMIEGNGSTFTGKAKVQMLSKALDNMNASSAYVVFEAGSRSHWHTHPVAQVIIVADGEGRSGVYGEPVTELKKGDVVVCPAGVKHFHGASPNERLVQMTITGETEDGSCVTWMEPVDDEQYNNTN